MGSDWNKGEYQYGSKNPDWPSSNVKHKPEDYLTGKDVSTGIDLLIVVCIVIAFVGAVAGIVG